MYLSRKNYHAVPLAEQTKDLTQQNKFFFQFFFFCDKICQ